MTETNETTETTATTEHGWTIVDREAGVLSREYPFIDNGHANTFVARYADGKLAVVSPCTGLTDGLADDLARFGEVSVVVANNGFHHLGIPEWRARFPGASFHAPEKAAARIAKKNPAAGSFESIAAADDKVGWKLTIRDAPATKVGESWCFLQTERGTYWYVSDLMCNWDQFPGNFVLGKLWKWTKSGPGFSLFNMAMLGTAKDKKVMLAAFLEDLRAHPPSSITLAHGPAIDDPTTLARAEPMVAAAL